LGELKSNIVVDVVDEEDGDPCSNFAAAGASFRRHKSSTLDEKGIFGLSCARHGTPLLFMDIYKGENFDFCDQALHALLKGNEERRVYLFYDIACKYGKNFKVGVNSFIFISALMKLNRNECEVNLIVITIILFSLYLPCIVTRMVTVA
jgi:hypothetical protein